MNVLPASLAVATDGTIYITDGITFNQLDAIKPDGTLKWTFPRGSGLLCSPALGADGTIYITGIISEEPNHLFAINSAGILQWSIKLSDEGIVEPFVAPVIGANGTIYVRMRGDGYNKVVAVYPPGIRRWTASMACSVYPFPSANTMAVGADGLIYLGTPCGKLYAITSGGAMEWDLPVTSQNLAVCAPVIAPDGTLYVAAYDNTYTSGSSLYAVYTSSRGLAQSPWPMLHRDVKHTGCAGRVTSKSPLAYIFNLLF